MNELKNKPRVFLSYSKRDTTFIERVYDDLRLCQIEPWRDDVEIRHGQPWLEAIFNAGLPTCDCVLVYFTPNSLESSVVKKEVDSSLIQKLGDDKILFLPYVSEEAIRASLRADIQTLQTPEWNDSNYAEMLPRVVAEIWRGFMERNMAIAISGEKVKRLEAERDLDQLRSQEAGVFSIREEKDFGFIWETLNRCQPVTLIHSAMSHGDRKRPTVDKVEELRLSVRLSSVLPFLACPTCMEHDKSVVSRVLCKSVRRKLGRSTDTHDRYESPDCPDLTEEFLKFGLVQRKECPRPRTDLPRQPLAFHPPDPYTWEYTEKMHRFKYWLTFTNKGAKDVEWELLETIPLPAEQT